MNNKNTIKTIGLISISLLLICSTAFLLSCDDSNSKDNLKAVWVQLGPDGNAFVRAITENDECPEIIFDENTVTMDVRALPDDDFQVLTCEKPVPLGVSNIEVKGITLKPPAARPIRIVVIGDTGCRMKIGSSLDDGFQACNDPGAWPFETVANQVAAWNPDLIIQVGDYVYREQPCPEGNTGCQGSPFTSAGMKWATWEADYFKPASKMLRSTPLVLVRGDHEKCERAGEGFFRFIDPFPLRPCMDFTDPYAIDLEGLQLIIMDTVQADDTSLSSESVITRYIQDFEVVDELATGNSWLLSHRPIWGVRPTVEEGDEVEALNVTVQDALVKPLPPEIELVITGHIHLAEVLSFTGDRPPQIVAGTGGTLLLPEITTPIVGMEIDGETVTHAAIFSTYGFFTFEPAFDVDWVTTIWNQKSEILAVCEIANKTAECTEN